MSEEEEFVFPDLEQDGEKDTDVKARAYVHGIWDVNWNGSALRNNVDT